MPFRDPEPERSSLGIRVEAALLSLAVVGSIVSGIVMLIMRLIGR
ncbi:hypothetical protein [Allosphingosinicella indica]|nr:hypothetical protein [Allosphingosinicella indica]